MKTMKEYYAGTSLGQLPKAKLYLPILVVLSLGFLSVSAGKFMTRGISISPFIDKKDCPRIASLTDPISITCILWRETSYRADGHRSPIHQTRAVAAPTAAP